MADAVAEQGSSVWGVVYELQDRDVGLLDAAEGYSPGRAQNAYRREERHVFLDGEDARPLAVALYFGDPQKNPLPNQKYKDQILVGAEWWHLPEDYIHEVLDNIEVAAE